VSRAAIGLADTLDEHVDKEAGSSGNCEREERSIIEHAHGRVEGKTGTNVVSFRFPICKKLSGILARRSGCCQLCSLTAAQ